ncbi:metallophosphoesterase [candidate division KSB1 bacterium]|nr:metallophosphoesterase [candidate division KSB1 bacterium]
MNFINRLLSILVLLFFFVGCPNRTDSKFSIRSEKQNPWTHLNVNNQRFFQFAIVGDRSGGLRPGVFRKAASQLNSIHPDFVMSIGDLIDSRDLKHQSVPFDETKVRQRWDEFNSIVESLKMPFFYVSGNNDIRNTQMEQIWREQFGRTYYSFVYDRVLFIVLNSDDPPGGRNGRLSDTQMKCLEQTLIQNKHVRWTFIFIHRPIWRYEGHQDWHRIQELLGDRQRTVFSGHHHRYSKSVINGHAHYMLATTGGSSDLSGIEQGKFDHILWVTMTDSVPEIANLLLDGILVDEPAEMQ